MFSIRFVPNLFMLNNYNKIAETTRMNIGCRKEMMVRVSGKK